MNGAVLRVVPERDVAPGGWIADQMRTDLTTGFVGHLDELAPDLILDDEAYGRDRLTDAVRANDLGAISDSVDWMVQFLWWNSETQSNWRDGWLRRCMLVGDESHRDDARAYVEAILASQDEDGYLGIYAPDLRFPEAGENGELWAQASLLRALLGWYGHSGDGSVLAAVCRAVARTMARLPDARPRERSVAPVRRHTVVRGCLPWTDLHGCALGADTPDGRHPVPGVRGVAV